MKIFLICIGVFLIISCANHSIDRIDFLIGTWKIENQNQFEIWTKVNNNELIGHSYKINENQKKILETLTIKMIDNQMIYEATVPDQNEGKSIQFALNPEITSYFSFENLNHDFPKRIQYEKISGNEIAVSVLGDDGQGFSYKMIKQVNE